MQGLPQENLIVFDGHCVLCSRLFHWVVSRDRKRVFQFATAQSDLGRQIHGELGLSAGTLETLVVLIDGTPYLYLDAVAQIARRIDGYARIFRWVNLVPGWMNRSIYTLVARNRYHVFGKTELCMVPSAEVKHRFAQNGFVPGDMGAT